MTDSPLLVDTPGGQRDSQGADYGKETQHPPQEDPRERCGAWAMGVSKETTDS